MTSIPAVVVAVAAAALAVGGRHISYHDDGAAPGPMVTRAGQRRLCTELCMSGLGGPACGPDCPDLTPLGLPVQSPAGNGSETPPPAGARRDVCPTLCANGLGRPLCGCRPAAVDAFSVDHLQVCAVFCRAHDYQLYGCPKCEEFEAQDEEGGKEDARPAARGDFKLTGLTKNRHIDYTKIDWNAWCVTKCHVGEGGAACNCDLLPMAFK